MSGTLRPRRNDEWLNELPGSNYWRQFAERPHATIEVDVGARQSPSYRAVRLLRSPLAVKTLGASPSRARLTPAPENLTSASPGRREQYDSPDQGAESGPQRDVDPLPLVHGEMEVADIRAMGFPGVAEAAVGENKPAPDDQQDGQNFRCAHRITPLVPDSPCKQAHVAAIAVRR